MSSFGRKWLYCNLQKYKHVQPKVTFKHQHIEHEETTTPSPTLIQPMKKITYRQYNTHPSIHNLLIYNTDRLLKLLIMTRAKRHRKVLRDNIYGITKPAIRRLARRGGVKRISGLIYEETRGVLKQFLTNLIGDAIVYTTHANRRTVLAMDIIYALKRQGKTVYGFGV